MEQWYIRKRNSQAYPTLCRYGNQNRTSLTLWLLWLIQKKWSLICKWYPGNCPPVRLGFGSRLELVLELGGNQTIAPVENYHRLGLGFGLGLVLGLGAIFLGRNCPRTSVSALSSFVTITNFNLTCLSTGKSLLEAGNKNSRNGKWHYRSLLNFAE